MFDRGGPLWGRTVERYRQRLVLNRRPCCHPKAKYRDQDRAYHQLAAGADHAGEHDRDGVDGTTGQPEPTVTLLPTARH